MKDNKLNEFISKHSRCPECKSVDLIFSHSEISCKNCLSTFPLFNQKPILVKQDNELFSPSMYINITEEYHPKRGKILSNLIPSSSVNISYRDNLKAFAKALKDFDNAYILILGCGQQKSYLDKFFLNYENINLCYCDIDVNATVDIFCDAHELPFVDGVFHGIITTAVLEHVLYPEQVVSEMYRVLVDGGIIYSEIPFIQQVHEGAYDFTRYNLSGHRRLLNHFGELSSGLVAGPGTALVWSIEHFVLCFSWKLMPRNLLKAGVRLTLFWLKYFDYLFKNNPQALDGASCTYFIGRKQLNQKTSDKQIIERYRGANNLQHI